MQCNFLLRLIVITVLFLLRAIREYDILNKNVQQLIVYTVARVKVQGGGGVVGCRIGCHSKS